MAWQAVVVPIAMNRRPVLLAAAALIALTGCKGGDSPSSDQSPDERMAEAKQSFDAAEYIAFTLASADLPPDIDGLLSAEGTGTHAPAFDGEVKVQTDFDITAPLVAVDDDVYVKLPFSSWSTIDPAAYGAPDPAQLLADDGGISSLFTATEGLEAGDEKRDGETVLTNIDGTIPGESVRQVFPSAGTDDFDVIYTLTDANDIDGIEITGPFYEGSEDVTYSIDLNLDGDPVEIEAPI
jgi:lipoprotein LprG